MKLQTAILMSLVLALSACARHMDSTTVSSSAPVGKVYYGTVVSVRQVTIKDNDKLQDNTLGGVTGGLAGGIAASSIGNGTGSALASVGGALAGAVLGAVAEDQLSTQSGYAYIVRMDGGTTAAQARNYNLNVGNGVADSVNQSMQVNSMSTQTISVIQTDATPFMSGQHVMVVYRDDHPRIVAM